MTSPTIVVSTWEDGVFVIDGGTLRHELQGRSVQGLAHQGDGSVLAVIDHHAIWRRSRDAAWSDVARSESPLSCCVVSRGCVFAGTDDGAHVLQLAGGALNQLESFDRTPGREAWVAGGAMVDGKWLGPPLGIRSMSASADGASLFANVHVGGIPRSVDRGASWHPTIDIDADVHHVVCHPSRLDLVAAAAGSGLCISRDGGATWQIETAGLDHIYCSAVAFVGDDVLVTASESPFASAGAIYRRPIDGAGPLTPVGRGLPRWMDGIVDTATIAACERGAAVVDRGGTVYLSEDAGGSWTKAAEGVVFPSAVTFI